MLKFYKISNLLMTIIVMISLCCVQSCNNKDCNTEIPEKIEFLDLSINTINCNWYAAQTTINVRANCDWSANCPYDWAKVDNNSTGEDDNTIVKQNGNGVIKISIEQNNTSKIRICSVVITYWYGDDVTPFTKRVEIVQQPKPF